MSDFKTMPSAPRTLLPYPDSMAAIAAVAVLGSAVVWSYWTTIEQLVETWSNDPQYSHGFLVPIFALIILWVRRPAELTWKTNPWGLLLLALSIVPRYFTARMDNLSVDGVCLVASIMGVVLFVGGTGVARWAWPAILFLGFMVPLPFTIQENIAIPLRRLATVVSTYVLQTFGYPALAEGNVIHIEQSPMRVEDACSGLGMLMTFFALSTAMAIIVGGPMLERIVLVVSAIPIAVFANVMRITITGMLYHSFKLQDHQKTIHDTLGYLMPAVALLLLWLELKFLRLLLPLEDNETPLTVPLSPWLERAEANKPKPRWS